MNIPPKVAKLICDYAEAVGVIKGMNYSNAGHFEDKLEKYMDEFFVEAQPLLSDLDLSKFSSKAIPIGETLSGGGTVGSLIKPEDEPPF